MADAVSMLLMRARGIDTAFTLDDDFRAEGFTVMP
jgi:predicted nucleic acid-binding protein